MKRDRDPFWQNMAKSNMDQAIWARYMLWEWTQGVGLYGLWKLFEKSTTSAAWMC